MSPKLSRLLFVAALVTGAGAPMFSAYAAGQPRTVDAYNMPRGFEPPAKKAYEPLEINPDDTVSWIIWEGEHTVTPKDSKQWDGTGSDDNLTPDAERYSKKFTTPGSYFYYCKIHGGINEHHELTGMWGVIQVIDRTPATQPPATQPPTTQPPATQPPPATTVTTRPSATPPATTATAPTTRPTPTTAAPTTTAPKADKDRKPKDETTTSTVPPLTPPPPPIDLPDEAIVPSLPSDGTTSNGAPGEAPLDTPEGEAVALLKGKKDGGGDAKKLLIVSGLGLGVLGFGTAGYKYANRSSKYFPA